MASDKTYKLRKQFNPAQASDDLAMVLLYNELTGDTEATDDDQVRTQYHAIVRKEPSEATGNETNEDEMTENDI